MSGAINWDKAVDSYFENKVRLDKARVTCGIPTKGRYDTLVQTLQSVATQTYQNLHIIIVDDSDDPKDLRELQTYQNIFRTFNAYNMGFEVVFGRKLGQHHSHQMIQEKAKTEFIWRIDDDELAEPDCLRILLRNMKTGVGVVSGLVPQVEKPDPLPPNLPLNPISDLNSPNIQWFSHPKKQVVEVQHVTSTFLYRKGVVDYDLSLSPAAHREDTIFSYEFYNKGYKVLVDPAAVTWHWRAPHGGIRSHNDGNFWNNDEKIFQTKLLEWGISTEKTKIIVENVGKGDHCVVKKLIPELREKYGKIVIASCFRDVFEDDAVEQISIAEAEQRFGNLDRFSIYKAMIEWNWKDSLENAYRKLYGIERKNSTTK